MSPQKAFGDVLKAMRNESGLSQERLAFDTGYHRTYISLLERGLKTPSLTTIFRLAAALNSTPSLIIGDVESRVQATLKRGKHRKSTQ